LFFETFSTKNCKLFGFTISVFFKSHRLTNIGILTAEFDKVRAPRQATPGAQPARPAGQARRRQ
jgi:hypothetical protein